MEAKYQQEEIEQTQKVNQIVEASLNSANTCTLNRNYGRAFAHYLLVFKLDDSKKESHKHDFTYVMREWTEELKRDNRVEDLFNCYEQACDVFPKCETALNNIGAQLFRLGYLDEGASYVRKAVRLRPNYVAARQNLENICSFLIDRWHFRMLNDSTRNQAYQEAIQKAKNRGIQSVLDIGAGTGLLSLYSVKAGIPKVYACEQSKTIHDVAKDVLQINDPTGQIKLVCKSSTELLIPQDIPERVDLVVTETFDAGLFGEHIISTLHHAFKNLFQNTKQSCVIPGGATVYIEAVQSETILNQNRFRYPFMQNVDLHDIKLMCRTCLSEGEPYTTEDLMAIRCGYTELSSPCKLLSVNFNDPSEIERLNNGLCFQMLVPASQTGRLDAIVLWFDLHIDDDITITTKPDVWNCWEQAVFPVLPQHSKNKDGVFRLDVKTGDTIVINVKLKDNHLNLRCCDIRKNSDISTNQITDVILDSETSNLNNLNDNTNIQEMTNEIFVLEHSEIANLNDLNTNRLFFQALERLRLAKNVENLSLLDISLGLSPLSLQAAILGYSSVSAACDEDEIKYIKRLAEVNNVSDKVTTLRRDCVTQMEEKYDVITCDLVESCGVLKQQILEDIALLRVTSLEEHGVILPGRVKIFGICVESPHLLKMSRVLGNEETSGFRIAEFINDFQSSTHVDIDLHTLEHSKLSESFLMFDFCLNPIENTDEPASYLDLSNSVEVNILESGLITAIVYWFELTVLDDLIVSSFDYNSHWKQAGIMMKSEVYVGEGQKVNVDLHLENSCIELKSLVKLK